MERNVAIAIVLWYSASFFIIGKVKAEFEFAGADNRTSEGICNLFIRSQGYTCDELQVQTEDGFILGMQRMSNGPVEGKKPVFLYHGMMTGGESWLLNEKGNSLPFSLADAGFDVWIGNTRTTEFSYGHVTLSRDDEGFWDWSTDELTSHDLPTLLQLVYDSTNQAAHYIGYSQGTQAAVAAFSEDRLITMVDRVVFLAPVVRVDSLASAMAIGASMFLVDQLMLLARVWEFNIDLASGATLMRTICEHPEAHCENDMMAAFTGSNCCVNSSLIDHYDKYETQSTAMKNLAHFAQQFRTRSFSKYDYGFFGNLYRYHSIFPPEYDLGKIPSMPMLVIHGQTDAFADADDVQLFVQSLTFSPQVLSVANYGHLDLLVSYRANIDVYSKVLEFISPNA